MICSRSFRNCSMCCVFMWGMTTMRRVFVNFPRDHFCFLSSWSIWQMSRFFEVIPSMFMTGLVTSSTFSICSIPFSSCCVTFMQLFTIFVYPSIPRCFRIAQVAITVAPERVPSITGWV